MKLLEAQDREASSANALQDLREGVTKSMNYFTGRPVAASEGPPKMDDAVRRYVVSRKLGAQHPVDPLDQEIKTLRARLLGKELLAPPKQENPGDEPLGPADHVYAKSLGINSAPLKTRRELLAQVNSRLAAGFAADTKEAAEERKVTNAEIKTVNGAIREIDTSLAEAEFLLREVESNPAAFSVTSHMAGYLGDESGLGKIVERVQASNRDPRDIETRAVVLKKAYEIKNKLAGAAVSKQEKASIDAFNPSDNDTSQEIMAKTKAVISMAKSMRDARLKQLPGASVPTSPQPASVPASVPPRSRSSGAGDKYLD
jgi:hypothetical protein